MGLKEESHTPEAVLIRAINSLMKERAIESVINPGKDQYGGNVNPEAGGMKKQLPDIPRASLQTQI